MKIQLIIGVIIIVIVGGGIYAAKRANAPQVDVLKQQEGVTSQMPAKGAEGVMEAVVEPVVGNETVAVSVQGGTYEPYDAAKVARADGGSLVLFFRAPWCPTCRALDANIRANLSAIPAGVTILDVDYDSSTALKQKYGVTYQHTMVQVDAQGNQIAKWTGSPTLSDLLARIQ